jgi:PAS domain S-box-containing protein
MCDGRLRMDQFGVDEALVETARIEAVANHRPSWVRSLLAATLPPLAALIVQMSYALPSVRWSLFYPAVFIASWLGGFRSGVGATLLSTALLWYYFMAPRYTMLKTDPRYYLTALIFIAMGIVVSTLHRRLRKVTHDVAEALLASRRLAERLQKLVDERRMLMTLIDNSPDLIAFADEHGTPVYMNPGGRRMIGLGMNFPVETTRIADFFPPHLREDTAEAIKRESFANGEWRGETSIRHWQTQQEIPVWVHSFQMRDPETNRLRGIGTVTRDISDIKRNRDEVEAANRQLKAALRDLEESQRFLQAILDHSPNGIIIKDLAGGYLLINKVIESITGVAVASARGKTDFDLFPRELAERFRANDKIVHDGMAPLVTEEKCDLKNGARVFLVNKFPLLDDKRRVFAICAIWTDITEHKRVEEALRQTATDLRHAQHISHVGSWSWNLRDKMEWSEEVYRIFGRDPSKTLPVPFTPGADIFTPESTERLAGAVKMLVAGSGPYEIELEFIRPDGSAGWVAARGENVRDADGKVIAITGTVEDITQLKDLQRLREEWTSVIAHDLRQPIGFIAMASDFLPTLHPGAMSDREKDMAQRIRSAALALARMVDDLLDMSLLEADRLKLERDWVDPRVLVSDTIQRLSHLTSEARVKEIDEDGLVNVYADPMRIGQVLGNLLSNAIKYGEKGGEIIVRLHRQANEVEIAVTNHGKGIEPEDLPRIFSRFMRSKSTHGSGVRGLGLGLYIAKGVIKAHGGRMWAESTPGLTTTFHVTLPTAIDSRQAA